MLSRLERKNAFIIELAIWLSRDLAKRSILLQMKDGDAEAWARVWNAAGLTGYPEPEEVEKHLRELLG